jgi:tripartite-type tricarboxylate transporter receptor subunit TctC
MFKEEAMKIARMVMAFCIVACLAAGAFAQDYPTKPVKMIVPFTAGSATDIIARAVSNKLSGLWGQPVVVENLTAAGIPAATDVVAKAPKDGYTLLLTGSTYAVLPVLYAKLPFDPLKDFIDIAFLASQPFVLVTSPTSGFKTVSELIAAAKAKPGQLKYGAAGTGSGNHFAVERFNMEAGIKAVYVVYQGGPEVNAAMMAGQITYWFAPLAIALKPVQEGKLIALGITSSKRNDKLPSVPTIAEAGIAGYEESNWWGIWAPAGIPAPIADKLAKDVARALASPDLQGEFAKLGYESKSMTSAEFARFVRNEMESSARTAKKAGIKPQ